MNRKFECLDDKFFPVPDGTLVNPFLNPKDAMGGLPWDLLDGLSIAAGQIDPGVTSQIHVHPYVSQVTVILSGRVDIIMKDPGNGDGPYTVELSHPSPSGGDGFTSAAVLTSPGTFFQLDNANGSEPARVLYLVSPSYIFEPGETTDSAPVYDDAIALNQSWDELRDLNWNPTELADTSNSFAARRLAIQRLAARSRTNN